MSIIDPTKLTVQDICTAALQESGVIGIGQDASGADIERAWSRLQFMLQEWERKRWLVYHLKTYTKNSTGVLSYTVGPGGDFDTGVGSVRPAKLESAYLTQIVNTNAQQGGGNLNVDYPLEILQSMEDYNQIALKSLQSFPGTIFMDASWPLAKVYAWPVPQATIYNINITVLEQLPTSFATLATTFSLPYEYYSAMLYNLAMRMRGAYQLGSFPGDELPNLAKQSIKTLRGANVAIARLRVPDMNRSFIYNIFSDRFY